MDIKETLEEISRLERDKAQAELRINQVKEKQDELAKRLGALGISPKDLDSEAQKLEISIMERLQSIKDGTFMVKTREPAVHEVEVPALDAADIQSTLESLE